jgi:hypothetical protein
MSMILRAAFLTFVCILVARAQEPIESRRFRILDAAPNEELLHEIEVAVEKAGFLVLRARNPLRPHAYRDTVEEVDEAWHYELRARCLSSCAGKLTGIIDRLRTARRVDGSCPNGFTVAIKFLANDGANILAVYASLAGQCLVVNGKSYLLSKENSVEPIVVKLIETSKL